VSSHTSSWHLKFLLIEFQLQGLAKAQKLGMGGKQITRVSKKWNGVFLALGVLSTGTILILMSFIPLIQALKQEANQRLLLSVQSKTLAVEEYFHRLQGIAKSITYQTQISQNFKVNSQAQPRIQPKTISEQQYFANLLSQFPEIAGFSYFDNTGRPMKRGGVAVPLSLLPHQLTSLKPVQMIERVNLDGVSYLAVSVPIETPSKQPVGMNIVLFKLAGLEKIINQNFGLNFENETVIGKIHPQGVEFLISQPHLERQEQQLTQSELDEMGSRLVISNYHHQLVEIWSCWQSSTCRPLNWPPSSPTVYSETTYLSTLPVYTPLGIAFQKSAEQGSGVLLFHPKNAPDTLIAYHRISESSWHLATQISTRVLFAPIYLQIAFTAGSLLALFWLIIGAFILWKLRMTHSAIRHLTLDVNSSSLNPTLEPSALQISDFPKLPALAESSVWEMSLSTNATDAFWEWNLITNEVYFSPQWKHWVARLENEITSHPNEWFKRIYPEDLERVKAEITVHLAGTSSYFRNEHRLLDQDGHYRWILTQAVTLRDATRKACRMAGSMTDITEYKRIQEETLHLAAFPKHDPNPVLACDQFGHLIYMNPATQELLIQLGYRQPEDLLPENHRKIVSNCLVNNEREDCLEVQLKQRKFSWSYNPIHDLNIVHLYGIDITDRQQAEEKLLQAAWHDSLTGLPNRTLFLRCLEQVVTFAKQGKQDLFAILFLDLDRFKVVNDSLGHLFGDQFLIEIAQRLATCLDQKYTSKQSQTTLSEPLTSAQLACQTNLVARLGGDEFIILLGKIQDISEVINLAESIQKELTLPVYLDDHEVFTTVSIGIAIAAYRQQPGQVEFSGYPYDQPEDLLRDADIAMYRAKALGKARYVVFDGAMHQRTLRLLQLENDLRRALHSETLKIITPQQEAATWSVSDSMFIEFMLYYQPIVALDTGRIAGFEALVRWQHPERGLVSPTEFIPVAEETGLIVPLGSWVLQQACWQLHKWQEQFPNNRDLTMTVNLSGKQLSQSDLLEQIDQILEKTGINPINLKLEITESVLMDNAAVAISVLEQLRGRNIGLCIDDFGTGYSSLSYLHRFPINTLKIDRSFVSEMSGDDENSEIVRAIVTLAHNLGMYVVAEGVETEKQLVQLWALQCEYGQGYFFSKPLTAFDAEALMATEPQW
jgi:PAS domain S-box-containing protein